jgi:tetratricopeptide (TPR) repeat protein
VETVTKGTEDFEAIFRRDPTDVDAFAALQRAYKQSGRLLELADLMERRASHIPDGHKAADLLWQAAEIHARQGDGSAESRVLSKALEQHKGHRKALDRLKAVSTDERRWTEVLRLLTLDAQALVESGGDKKRLARVEHEIGQVWEDQFNRLDQAIVHFQAAFKADPGHIDSIEAGRRIYRSVGRWKTVAALYQVELSTCQDPQRRVPLLLELGQLQHDNLGDLEGAARSYQEASQIRAGDESILEALGEIYASPEWPTPGGLDKAAAIFMQIAQARQTRGDRDGAIAYLRRALGADSENEAAYNRLEKAYEETGRWEDLDRLYRQRLSVATEMETTELLMRRGELLERKLGDRKAARDCYEKVLAEEPLGGPASNRLMQLYRADKDWDRLLDLHQRALDATQDPATRIRLMMEMSAIHREHLGDPEAAAHLLHEVLQLEPDHRKALDAYEDYFRQKGDYRNLSELLRFAAQSAGDAGAPPMEVCARLEELADVSERHLGDLEGAIEAWQQIARLHPDVQRSKEALGRLGAKLRMWQGMVNVLERELAQAMSPEQRLQALHRMAQVYYDKKADPQRTIEILRQVLEQAPHDESALRMIVDLYERESDFEGLSWALERKLDGIMTKAERVNVLRRLGEIYSEKLDRPNDALRAFNALLEQAPPDAKTHDRIQALLERMDDIEGLTRALELRSQASRSVGERLAALKTLARLMDDRLDDPARAAAYWEEFRAQDAEDTEALEALGRLYDRMARSRELLEILDQRLAQLREQDAPTSQLAEVLRRIAVVADERLGNNDAAIDAYEQLTDILPGDREAMDALGRLYARVERFEDLVVILGRQIELCDDAEQRVVLAFKQGDVLEERLGNLDGAALIYEKIIEEYAPGDLDAHRRLKHLYRKRGDFASASEIAERELFLTDVESPDHLSLSLEIAALWRDSVRDEARAQLAFERVLERDPDSPDALSALRRLYHRNGEYIKLAKMAPALFASLTDPQERLILLLEVAQVYEEKLNEPESAFEWYRRAHDLYPEDENAIGNLERLAREHGLWEELITGHLETRKRSRNSEEQIELTCKVAAICREQLGDPSRAFQVLQQALRIDPTGASVLADLEELADACGQHGELLEIYDRIISRSEPERQKELLDLRVRVAEHRLGDPGEALGDVLRLYELFEDDPLEQGRLVAEVERLAGSAGHWEEAINLHGRRFQEAPSLEEQLAVLSHVAELLEQQVGDLGRAFMVHLHAFRLKPDDEGVILNLWRLAGTIDVATGTAAGDQIDEVEEIEDEDLLVVDEPPLVIEPLRSRRRRDTTIDDPTLLDSKQPPPPPPPPLRRGAPPPIPSPQRQSFAPHPPARFSAWEELAQAHLRLESRDTETRIERMLEVARIWTEGAGNLDRAVETLAEAATISIEHPALAIRLEQLAEAPFHRFDSLVQIYTDALERSADAETLVRLNIKLGSLLAAHERLEEAAHHFSAVLAIVPGHAGAADHLRALFRSAERWQDLASLLERQLEVLSGELNAQERADRLLELADLYQHTLKRPFEAVDFLARRATELPRDLDVRLRLADLYEELSIWAKQIEVLEVAVQLSDNATSRVNNLLRIGRTYEQELELPDRAIEAYQAVLTEQPHNEVALEALQHLYEAHERQDDLIGVLRLRVELADPKGAARPLLIRLAQALEELGSPEEARVYLQQARGLGPRDPDVEEALARILVQTGRPDEAVELIEGQIEAARGEGRPPAEIASLLVRLARLQDNQLGDPTAARATLEEAMTLDSRNPEVLAELAQFFYNRESWNDYVEALARLARVTPHEETGLVQTLLSAAALVYHKVQDREGAIRLGELVLQRDPGHMPAVDMLVGLSEPEPERQEAFLRLKADLVEDPKERAVTLTRLGQALQRRGAPAEDVAGAHQRALELDGDLVPAIDALSELFVSRQQLEPARALLVEAIDRLGLSRDTGPLYYRLGQIFEQLGRDEDGHRYLSDALRLDSRNLHLRIAVGQNRFRAERWREALRHLQEVQDHPDAAQHPEAAAEALYTAGLCEANLRRGDRASRFYEAALALNPDLHGAIHELAQASLSKGDWERAVEHLQREIALTDPNDSAALYSLLKTLGNIQRDQLGDVEGAADSYARLFEHLPDEEASLLETLPHILPTLREARRHEAAARAAEALAEVMWGEREKRDLLLAAAAERRAAGDIDAAQGHFDAVLALDPTCLEAADAMSEMLAAEGKDDAVADLLGRVLPEEGSPPPPPGSDTGLLARLFAKLGMVHARLGQVAESIKRLEHALTLEQSAEVREALVGLYGDAQEHRTAALANHRELLQLAPQRVDSLLALAGAHLDAAPYRAYCFFQALQTLDAIDEQGISFLASYTPPTLDIEESYAGEIGADERWSLIALPEVQAFREIFATLWDAAPTLFTRDLGAYGISPDRRLSPMADSNLAKVYGAVARALGIKQTVLYLSNDTDGPELRVVCMAPPAVVVSEEHSGQRNTIELRFLVGRALELTQPAYVLAAGLSRVEFARLFSSVLKAFHPRHMRGRKTMNEEALEQAARLRRNLPFKITRKLGELFRKQTTARFDSGAWRQAILLSANRMGLALCGDVGTAVRLVAEDDPELAALPFAEQVERSAAIRDLLAFSVSDAYYATRVKLGLAGKG